MEKIKNIIKNLETIQNELIELSQNKKECNSIAKEIWETKEFPLTTKELQSICDSQSNNLGSIIYNLKKTIQ